MINGVHVVVYSHEAQAVRDFFREILELPSVDAGDGWLLFGLPPAELGIHPMEGEGKHELYLMCEDIEGAIARIESRSGACGEVTDQGWGLLSSVELPDGSRLGLYQPRHPTALDLGG